MAGVEAPGRPRLPAAVPLGVVRRHPWAVVFAAALLVLVGLAVSAETASAETRADTAALLSATGRLLMRMSWVDIGVIVALSGLHYIAAALAARAAAGVNTPFGETVLVQLGAAAANRLTPAGLGGSAVLARYFVRRAGLAAAAALGAVAALTVLGGLADLAALAVLVLAGRFVGLPGGPGEVRSLVSRVDHLLKTSQSPWLWVAVGATLLAVAIALWGRRRHATSHPPWLSFFAPVARLARRPGSLATLVAASAGTTVILAVAFAATTHAVPGPRPVASIGALMIGYMIAAAASNSLPIPAGIGATETALVAVLVLAHVPAAQAFEEVMIFRVITFWTPALLGLAVARRLRRAEAL